MIITPVGFMRSARAGVESEWCLSFDGVDDYVSGSHSINLTATDISISGWVFFSRLDSGPNDSFANPRIIEIRDGSYSIQVIVDFTSGRWVTKHTLWQTSITGTQWNAPTAGAWVHIAAVFYTGTLSTKFFVNGVEQTGSSNSNIGQGVGVNTFHIGTRSDMAGTTRFNGRIDDVRVYSRALSPTEVAAIYNNISPPTDVTAYLPLETGTGTTTSVLDSTGATIATATLVGGATWHPQTPPKLVSGRETSVRSLVFDGTDDRVLCDAMTPLTEFTVSAWAKLSATRTYHMVLVTGDLAAGRGIDLRIEGGRARIISGDSESTIWSPGVYGVSDGWLHLAATRDSLGGGKLYVNGVVVASGALLAPNSLHFGKVMIGTYAAFGELFGALFQGCLDDVQLFSTALTAAQIRSLARGQSVAGAAGHWKGDETSGTLVADYGSGGNDGTCVGGVTRSTDVPAWLTT